MKRQIKMWSVLVMIVLLSSFAMAVPKSAVQQAETSDQLLIGTQDVITASDAGGGYLTSRDLILIIAIGVVILVLVAL